MRRTLALLVLILSCCGVSLSMTPEYSSYVTESADASNNVYVSAVVEGTTINCYNNCSPAQHQGSVYLQSGPLAGGFTGDGPHRQTTST